jgi:hypothetical protein
MKRFLHSVLAISSVLAVAAAVQAGDHHQGHSGNQGKPQSQFGFGNWSGVSQIVSDFKSHHSHKPEPKTNPIPIDPGRGDGRVPVNPPPLTPPVVRDHRDGTTSQGAGGFVFVDGHWERAKAAPKVVNPYPAGTTVRDHRSTTGSFPPGATVRDHRATTESFPAGTTVRDHRTTTNSNASGGVTVIVTNPLPDNAGPTIRDHRTAPVIRDHRTAPVVRDHRTPAP